ncbi:MAG: hypothetical protein ORN98_06910, partial [Alphaproteobacteria bacterium]|nr:hypothetical protein [Alphaproteobacteria bacterium]
DEENMDKSSQKLGESALTHHDHLSHHAPRPKSMMWLAMAAWQRMLIALVLIIGIFLLVAWAW